MTRGCGDSSGSGWSILEMLLVLLMLAVLAAAAYPSYSQFVVRSKRVEGQTALMTLMQQQERYFSGNNSYIAFSSASIEPAARQFRWWSGSSATRSAYEVEGKACDGERIEDCVELVATPGGGHVDIHYKDDECGKLILRSSGLRLASGPGARCWQ
jgi:type IV pilus assembly protein PilE